MKFTKMQGAGNDYVYVDCFREPLPADPAELARRVADRHYGIGGDGLILICPSQRADARMRMFNADGSESEMCGNGVRCVAKYVHDHGIAARPTLTIETGAGVLQLELEVEAGRARRVKVDMGIPVLEAEKIPVALPRRSADGRVVDLPLDQYIPMNAPAAWMEACGLDPRMTCVSMGNPHVVIYCQHVAAVPLETIGPFLETQPIFPRRINVHFVEVHSPGEVTMRTWERGSGITLACGTGASAVCVAGGLTGQTSRRILAHLPGGDLELDWAANDHVYMTGPAVEVFSGEWHGEVR
ncbi:MAG TPA: diaminopimelate epimerase [Pirellulales bacterium]|jgi:diaminopimelate epimerase|nr:diaminopimelate epimerase [Pirellulales bacterium]